jgi:hypothetical protein
MSTTSDTLVVHNMVANTSSAASTCLDHTKHEDHYQQLVPSSTTTSIPQTSAVGKNSHESFHDSHGDDDHDDDVDDYNHYMALVDNDEMDATKTKTKTILTTDISLPKNDDKDELPVDTVVEASELSPLLLPVEESSTTSMSSGAFRGNLGCILASRWIPVFVVIIIVVTIAAWVFYFFLSFEWFF